MKKSGKRLSVAQVVAANTPDLIDEGFARALDAAEAIAAMCGSEVAITAAVEQDEPAAGAAPADARADEPPGHAEPATR